MAVCLQLRVSDEWLIDESVSVGLDRSVLCLKSLKFYPNVASVW